MTTATADHETADAQEQFKAEVAETLHDAGVLTNDSGAASASQTAEFPRTADASGEAQAPTAAMDTGDATNAATPDTTPDTANVGDQAPPDPTSSAAQLAYWQRLIRQREDACAISEGQWQLAKESAKEAKAEYELAVKLLRRLIRESSDPQRKLPFNNEAETPSGKEAPQPAEFVADPDAWRSVSIDALGLTPRIVKSLTEAGVTDLGKIADYTAANDGLNGITGIGPVAQEQISDAMENYWRENPQPSAEASEDESADGQSDQEVDDLDDDDDFDDEEDEDGEEE
jgi:hypothetical protein